MSRQKVISASDAARLIPDGAIVTVSSSSALGCPDAVLAAIGRTVRDRWSSAEPDDSPPDRGRRHVGSEGYRPLGEGRVPRPGIGRLLSVRPIFRRAARNLEDDHWRRNPGLQRAIGYPV